MHDRENALREWLSHSLKGENFVLTPLFGDASFRRYFRLIHRGLSRIVMDAPPTKENMPAFIDVANILGGAGVLTPEIITADQEQGFLLCTDFGDDLLLKQLNPETVEHYYSKALGTLHQIQTCTSVASKLPHFDAVFMQKEMDLCSEWFFKAYLGLQLQQEEQALFRNTIEWIAEQVAQQPLVFIHRDYHSRNLMVTNTGALGVIDFQDAMLGPITYDLASLLKDCYISWPREKVLVWVESFRSQSPQSKAFDGEAFIRGFDLCALQRHLKVLGIFCRLKLRDNKAAYLNDLPLTLNYVRETCELYPELLPFHQFLQERVNLP